MNYFVLLATVVLSVGARADIDQRFTFTSAAVAYANARVPRSADLVGHWLEVGEAYRNFSNYAADGIYANTDGVADGRFFSWTFTSVDLFGAPAFQVEDLVHDPKETWRADLLKVTDLADSVDLHEIDPDKHGAALHYKCRLTTHPEVLICELLYDWQKAPLEMYSAHVRIP